MIMKRFLSAAAAAAVGVVLVAGSADASITFVTNQGPAKVGTVALARSNTANMLDGNTNTMYSLGLGGTLTASIFPDLIASVSVIELTIGNNTRYPESMEVFLGDNLSTAVLLGELFNVASGDPSINGAGFITTTANDPGTGRTSFKIALGGLSGTSSSLIFRDTTVGNFGLSNLTNDADGFDIAELRIAAVPLPAGVLLLGLGLGGLAAYRRRAAA